MEKTIFDLLEETLDDLSGDQFKRFTYKLTDPGQKTRVSRSAVEDKDRGDIARLLLERFTQRRALEITLQLLRNIKANQAAENLEKEAAANGFSISAESGGSPGTATPNLNPDASKATFIDENWVELVQRAAGMNAILDVLLSKKIINHEQYSEFCAESTPQKMMRRLICEAIRSTGTSGKAVLYNVLMDQQPYMMKDLGAS